MSGITGRSGPPGNQNAIGNPGGKGGPVGNAKSVTHGVTSYLRTGKLPRGCGWLAKRMRQFQQSVTAAVQEALGEVGIADAALIQSACRHETVAQLMLRHLRRTGGLTFDQEAKALQMVQAATDRRDKCLAALKLSKATADPWAAIHARPVLAPTNHDTTDQSAVSGAPVTTGQGSSPGIHPAGGVENNGGMT